MREWRRSRPPTDQQRREDIARSYASVYKRRGKLVPLTECEWCGEGGELNMHHPDYDRPLFVHWLHPECHREVHETEAVLDPARALAAERAASTRAPRRTRSQILADRRAKEAIGG